MKSKILCFFILQCLLANLVLAQDKPTIINASKILNKGVEFYENEKYESALKEFDKIPEQDTAFYTTLVEKGLTYYQLKQYEKGIECGKRALGMTLYLSPELFTNMGSSYDNLEKYAEALKIYEQGTKLFPKNNVLCFNNAYTLLQLGRNKEAFECYKKSGELNPFHPGTHFALGVLAMNEGKTSLAMMAFSTFIMLSPNNSNAGNALYYINEMASTKYKETIKSRDLDVTDGDDFTDIDMLIENYIALNKKYKVPSKLEIPYVKQVYLLFDKLPMKPEYSGFWYKMYVPFFKQLLKEDKFDVFVNFLLIPSSNEIHKKMVEKNKAKLTTFSDWAVEAWNNTHPEIELNFNGKTQKVSVFRANRRYAISSIGTLDKEKKHYIGYCETYHANGKLKSYGNWNVKGNREGEWIWYHENGTLKSKEMYTDGKLIVDDTYDFLGMLETHIPYKNEKIEGEAIAYTIDGCKDKLIVFKDNIRNGNYEEYYSDGQVFLKGAYKNGKMDGIFKNYYATGELKSEKHFLEDEKNGPELHYFKNGSIRQKSNYVKNKLQGDFVTYFKNGNVSDSLKYMNGKPIGQNLQYYSNGIVSVKGDFDESGKLNGMYYNYDLDGKLFNETEYRKGEIIGYKYFNKKGEIVKQDKKRSGNFDFEGYYANGNKRSAGKYGKEDKQGEWKFFDINGNLESVSNYVDGKAVGDCKKYFTNGKVSELMKYAEDMLEGYYVQTYRNGNILTHGNFSKDYKEGNWTTFYPDKTLEKENYYIGGYLNGEQRYHAVNGKVFETKTYYKGVLLNNINLDTLGNAVDSVVYINASGKRTFHYYKGGPVKSEVNVIGNDYQGLYMDYYPDGKVQTKGNFLNGRKSGPWTYYHWSGKISSSGVFENDEEEGVWNYYDDEGRLLRTTEFENGKRNGKETYYFENGKIESERQLIDNKLHGVSFYYSPDGGLEHKRLFMNDQLVSYTYFDATGSEKTVNIENETAEIKIYFKNGKLARQFKIEKGLYQGDYLRYYNTGQLYEKMTYIDDEANGENTYYYANGKIKLKRNYLYGRTHGTQIKYYEDGKIKESTEYVYDNKHGNCLKYNKMGKVSTVLHAYNDEIIEIIEK